MTVSLSAQNVVKRYGAVVALKSASVAVTSQGSGMRHEPHRGVPDAATGMQFRLPQRGQAAVTESGVECEVEVMAPVARQARPRSIACQ